MATERVYGDEALTRMASAVRAAAVARGMVRERAGYARGVWWCEMSGRSDSGSWLEMRLHHRPSENRVQAGFLEYLPLASGGRTHVHGETSESYGEIPVNAAVDKAVETVKGWL